ncbi:hypothetical protein KR009_011234, partial [Drosophila setifemur]
MTGFPLRTLCLLLGLLGGGGGSPSEFYTAGVAEFRPALMGGNSEQLLAENLEGYLELIASGNGSADIVVFSEATLNSVLQLTAVPETTEESLCEEQAGDDPAVAPFLRRLACAAREFHTYLVVNVKERAAPEECPGEGDCSSRGHSVYNTNVVFDRRGAVVSRYRKWNLYLEPMTNRTERPELATFRTDFNVTFGHFVCFDMLFYSPAQELVERMGIRNVIVTKMFNSELPFLTATQFQQGWAWANNVNLLASGASLPQAGISGSGIYAGAQGALARLIVKEAGEGQRRLILARVPVDPQGALVQEQPSVDWEPRAPINLKLLQQPQLENFTTWQLPLVGGSSAQKRLCQEDLCCDFEVSWSMRGSLPGYNYRLGVWVGERRYEEEQYSSIRLCGLFACRTEDVESCGLLGDQEEVEAGAADDLEVEFTELRIKGEFVQRPRRLISPSTLSSTSLHALQPDQLSWSKEELDGMTIVRMELRRPHRQLMTFGIYGNYFDEYAGGGASQLVGSCPGIILLLLLAMMHLICR